ncbi:uncharacterized protein LOC135958020 [Calliphora vicina]|uniref:uncharacterized protein LOC135958020 n=1 Tax=Calliphora vicina TaxID=7373 RepID=UPI00325ACAD4
MDATSSISSLSNNLQLCRICISSTPSTANGSSINNCSTQMISIFGEDSLWKKITTLADVKIERGDTLPQQVCITCAKNTISACLFKKKCEDADNFYRQQLLIRKIESKSDHTNTVETEDEDEVANDMTNGQIHKLAANKSDEELELDEHNYKHQLHRQINGGDHRLEDAGDNENHEIDDDDDHHHGHVVEDDGEIKSANGQKPAFDFNSIRLMHEYMQQHLSKLNGIQRNGGSDDEAAEGTASETDQDDDDEDGPLPLIPEIELITPSEDGGAGATVTNGTASAVDATSGMTHMRGYQCPHCFQIFEMKQVLKAHMQSVHGTSGPVYECTNCKKTYFYKRFLEKHIRRGRCVKKRRNQTRPMQCTDCNVLFPTGHHLGWHKRTGCPSKTAKMPLQQLFKQNIVQYNNFPRRIGIRKPENAIYLHNRKIIMANNKRKGRTRIKLDAKKIALAKQLILREATTTVIANELNISRTFAWRLRKSLVNGVSLHERVIDPPEDEEDDNDNNEAEMPNNEESEMLNIEKPENQLNHQPFTEHIKRERAATEDEEEEDHDNNNQESDNEDHHRQLEQHHLELQQQQQQLIRENNNVSVATSVIQRTNELKLNNAQQQQQLSTTTNAILEQHKLHNKISVVQQQRLMEINKNAHLDNNDTATDTDSDNDDDPDSNHRHHQYQRHKQQQQNQQETEHVNSQQQQQQQIQQSLYLQKSTTLKDPEDAQAIPLGNGKKLPLLNHLSPAVAAAIHQLPVNLSIRPIASMQNNETSSNNISGSKKKPRKPNVFIDDEKYAMAKMLVAQNASTMEIAKALNVSQMTAWKLRDAIIKGVPLSYRNRRDIRMTMMRHDEDTGSVLSEGSDTRRETDTERQQQALLVQQQLDHQQKLQQQHLQQQQQIQQLLQRQQQLQQQQQQLEQQKQQRQQEREREQQQQLLQKQKKQLQQQQQQSTQQIQPLEQKHTNPRRRLKAAEREVRDKEITREILELIKEDNNIQYWKVSARLAEKGYAISPSSVCQKLKSMGIHRRWKPGDKPPLIDMEQLKGNTNAANHITTTTSSMAALATAAANAQNASSSADESYEQQFDMSGAHFLSAFTTR